jgi:6-phosphogluconate dehydrogenase
MVHNGIEYGNMQLLAESYDLMKRGLGLEAGEMADRFAAWNEEELESYLVEITAAVLRVRDEETDEPLVEMVLDRAGQKGTGRWTVEIAVGMGVPVPTIAAAVDARVLSSYKERRLEAEKVIGGPQGKLPAGLRDHFPEDLRRALYLATVCSYAQGFDLIRTASDEYDWSVDLREVARIWKGGCIIRARLLDPAMAAFAEQPALPNLVLAEPFRSEFEAHHEALRRVIASASLAGTPLPALSASLAWFDAWRTGRLPQNLIQAQRDAFGAHTYERTDRPDSAPHHTDWLD